MPQASLDLDFDRLSKAVDAAQFERLRWSQNDAPVLAKLVELAQAAVADRSDFELSEEGASTDIKRFILKIHGIRMMGIKFWVENGHAMVASSAVERSRYRVAAGEPIATPYAQVGEEWMAEALHALFGRIEI